MKVGLEKLESHEGVAVKALLDSRATGLFMDMTFAREKGFRMERMKNPLYKGTVGCLCQNILKLIVRESS